MEVFHLTLHVRGAVVECMAVRVRAVRILLLLTQLPYFKIHPLKRLVRGHLECTDG